ncbi:MAG TPA: hypothetical protein VML19_28120 [Verrucomicrobiae bacterium]|nr:hypothetical protein [Verrucomicrobiae bacterium]
MFGLEKVADEFDKIYESSQKDMTDLLLVRTGRWSGETFGPDSWFGGFLGIFPAIAWSLYSFAAFSGKSLVDVLRLGEGVKKGTVGGVVEDGVRVLNLLPVLGMAGKGAGMALQEGGMASKFVATTLGTGAAGGEYATSCGATANVVAARISGQRILLTLDEFGNALGKGSPKSASFAGTYFDEMIPALNRVGANASEIKMAGPSVQTIEGIAAQGKGPVVFGVQWWGSGPSGTVQALRNAAVDWSAADHWLAAFQNVKGEVMVADQFGVRPIADLGKIGGQTAQFSLTTRALMFENVGFAARAGRLIDTGKIVVNAAGKLTGASNPALRSWLAMSLGVEMVLVSKPVADKMDGAVRKQLGRPPRKSGAGGGGSGQSGQQGASAQSGTSPQGPNGKERDYIRPMLGAVNSRTPSDEIYSRLIHDGGFTAGRVTTVLEEMEKSGEVSLVRNAVGRITYIIRRR